jgi:hypothetical protein
MQDEAKKRLMRILGAYDDKLAETERLEAESRAAKAAFPERFSALKKEMILPALREISEMLAAHGHEATVHEQDESSSSAGGVASAAISLRITTKRFFQKAAADTKKSFIEVTFSANRSDRKIVVSSTTTIINSGGSIGKRGEYEIETLTADAVVNHVLQTLETAFAGG